MMRYYPYFGDDAADDEALGKLNLEEVFVDKIKNAQEDNMRAESEFEGSLLCPFDFHLS